jgi:ankyrin repeat protein
LAKIFLDSFVDKITVSDVKEAISQLPKHTSGAQEDQRLIILDQAYDSAWTRIEQQKEGFRNIGTRVLAWITYAKRPLYTDELQHALAVKVGNNEVGNDELDEDAIPQVHDMVSFCAGLVTIDKESNIIKLVHYTTQEYFERKKSDWFPDAEAMIAETCISYLSLKAFDEYHLSRDNHIYLCSHPFYGYASGYWGDHARIVGKRLNKIVLKFLMSGAKASNAFHVALWRFCYIRDEYISALEENKQGRCDFIPMSGMHLAVLFALDEAILSLLKDGCPMNANEAIALTPLFLAIKGKSWHIAQILLDNGDHLSLKAGHGSRYADGVLYPMNYNQSFVERLISAEVAFGEDISWFLQPAMQYRHDAIVELLLRLGADVNTSLGTGMPYDTPLHNAVSYGNKNFVKLLLDKGANAEKASYGNGTLVKLLLDKSANLESASKMYGKRKLAKLLLHKCAKMKKASYGKKRLAKLLLNKGTKIEKASYGNKKLVESLLDEGAKIKKTSYRYQQFVKLLLDKGAHIEKASDFDGEKPLHVAIKNKNPAIIGLLLEKGANIEASNRLGETPLHWAAWHANVAAINYLLDKGANIEARNISGQTPLFFAVSSDHYPYMCDHKTASSLLLMKGANVEAVDSKGRTPLLYAVQKYMRHRSEYTGTYGQDEIQLLLDEGANVNAADNEGRTPLSYELIERWNENKGVFDNRACFKKRETYEHVFAKILSQISNTPNSIR